MTTKGSQEQQQGGQKNFQEKELSHSCSTLRFERLFVVTAATVYQESHFCTRLRSERPGTLSISVFTKSLRFEFIAMRDLI